MMISDDFENIDLRFSSKGAAKARDTVKFKKKVLKNVISYFREYCDATSIHGFRYFGEARTIWEKIWWFIVFVICLILCVFSILSVYKKWEQTPVIVTFATKGKSISDIPFPAITVCSESKVKRSVFEYQETMIRKNEGELLTEKELNYLGHVFYLCDIKEDLNYTIKINASEPENFFDVLKEVTPDFSIENCRFLGQPQDCAKIFVPIITDEGFCYTFNILDRKEMFNDNVVHYSNYHNIGLTSEEWSIEHGYRDGASILSYPTRALLAGARYGLQFHLKTENEKVDTLCRGSVEGFRLLFHAPMRIPRPSQQYIRVPYNRALSAAIRPTQITTSEAVKNYAAKNRQCYFPFEKKLTYFRSYSQINCDTECLTNYTLDFCHCVLFYMPRENTTRICGPMDYTCTLLAEYQMQFKRLYNRIVLKNINAPPDIRKTICNCMPMCSDIEYRVGSSQSVWNWSEEIGHGSERNELYGPTDFLANFGGLLGLFTGFSILSLLEIIYFLSVRLICNVRLYGNWAGIEK